MFHNTAFGEIEYDYSWFKYSKIDFFDKETEIIIIIAGDETGEFEKGQDEAYQLFMASWNRIQNHLSDHILEYYKKKREELGYHLELNENYPEINTNQQLLQHVTLVGIKIPYTGIYGGRSVGISFDCTWDKENGLGLRLKNEEIIAVGYQDIAV